MLDLVMKEMNFELLRASCSRLIFCHCGSILDVDRSVLASFEYDGETMRAWCMCTRCWDNGNGERFATIYKNVKRRIEAGESPGKDPDLYQAVIIDGRD